MSLIKVVLVGQPNVGKTALLNAVSNARLKEGNFSGVTVHKKTIYFQHKGYDFEVTDLPGSYSLSDYSIEEKVTKDYINTQAYDIILNVLDSSVIERHLFLTAELMLAHKKMVLALNMSDESAKKGITIDTTQMGKLLGAPCVLTSAKKRQGIEALLDALIHTHQNDYSNNRLQFSPTYHEEIENISDYLGNTSVPAIPEQRPESLAINLLRGEKDTYNRLHELPLWMDLQPLVLAAHEHLQLHYHEQDVNDIFNQEIAAFAKGIVTETVQFSDNQQRTLTHKIDAILINNILGLPIFLGLMWGLFQLTFTLGNIPMGWIESFFGMLSSGVQSVLGDSELSAVLTEGVIAGVGSVVLFLPNIIILFLGITLLETTGYMSRVSFLLDGFFHKFGLHGKSFIPLVTGFGCSVPAYMAARTLKNDRDRLLTLFIIGFMSCGARLPIYVLFVGAFVAQQYAGHVLFAIYISGVLFGIVAAKILKMTAFKGDDEPFVMEMPQYRLPSAKLIFHSVSGQAKMYLKKAGTFILLASVLIWFASTYPKHPVVEQQLQQDFVLTQNSAEQAALQNTAALYQLENSYLGKIGQFSEPFFRPLGFDWRMAVALETGLAAKEVVVTTLGVLYGIGDAADENNSALMQKIKDNISLPAAVAFILFIMIYLPCFAASAVFMREAGHWKYLGYLFVFTSIFAWLAAFIGFHLTRLMI